MKNVFSSNAAGVYLLYLLPALLQVGVGILMIPLTTYYLTAAYIGTVALLMAIAMPVKAFAPAGATWVISGNYFKLTEAGRRTMLFNVLVVEILFRSLLCLSLFLVAELVLRWLVLSNRPEYRHYLNVVLVASLAGSLWPTISYLMMVQNRPRALAIFSLMQTLSGAFTAIICLSVLGLGPESLFLSMLIASCVSLVMELFYVYRFVDFSFDSKWVREIGRTGLMAAPGGLAEAASNMIDKLAIQHWVGLSNLGIYSHSQNYQGAFKMINAAFTKTVTQDGLKVFSQALDTGPLERKFSIWYGILAVMGVGVSLFSEEVINLLTHNKLTASAPLVLVWYLFVFTLSHAAPYTFYLLAHKRNRVLMYTQLVPTLFGIGLVLIGTYFYGVMGAAWMLLLTSVVVQTSRYLFAYRMGYKGIAERPFAEALAVYVLLCFLDHLFVWTLDWELLVSALLVPALVVRFGLLRELKRVFSSRKLGPLAE